MFLFLYSSDFRLKKVSNKFFAIKFFSFCGIDGFWFLFNLKVGEIIFSYFKSDVSGLSNLFHN